MIQYSSSLCGVMEPGDHFKNGASPKSQMSRENLCNAKNNLPLNITLHDYLIFADFMVFAINIDNNPEGCQKVAGG